MQRDEELFEMVRFIKDNAITRADLQLEINALEYRMDQRFDKKLNVKIDSLRSDLMSHIDGLYTLFQKVDHEVTALHYHVSRLEENTPTA